MKKATRLLFGVAAVLVTITSCKKDLPDLRGCIDNLAANYNSFATVDDGTCEYLLLSEDFKNGDTDMFFTVWNSEILDYGAYGWVWHQEGDDTPIIGWTWFGDEDSNGDDVFNYNSIGFLSENIDFNEIPLNYQIILEFDLKQTCAFGAYGSWFRIRADEDVLKSLNNIDYHQPSSFEWSSQTYDLSNYIGTVKNIRFESCTRTSWSGSGPGDNTYIDNIRILAKPQN